jgi:Ni/Co efflux regulator RcnB
MEGYPGGGYGRPGMGYPTGPPPMPPPRRGFRRGEFMPPAFTSGQALDPRRYHLRTPPPGYVWYGVGRDAYLVQRASGMILDTAPGVW